MSLINPNCDGSHCRGSDEVRIFPLGAGGNLHLCRPCFAFENDYRLQRALEHGNPDAWPIVPWRTAVRVIYEPPAPQPICPRCFTDHSRGSCA